MGELPPPPPPSLTHLSSSVVKDVTVFHVSPRSVVVRTVPSMPTAIALLSSKACISLRSLVVPLFSVSHPKVVVVVDDVVVDVVVVVVEVVVVVVVVVVVEVVVVVVVVEVVVVELVGKVLSGSTAVPQPIIKAYPTKIRQNITETEIIMFFM